MKILKFVKRVSITAVLTGALLATGCSHSLVIKNLPMYKPFSVTSFDKPIRIGIVTDATDPETKALLGSVASALGNFSAQVTMPYAPNSQKEVDAIVRIDLGAEHKGSGWNFLINFPGFLIFTPAWNGYVYKVNYKVNCLITKASNSQKVDEFILPIGLNIRHADINRTWTGGLDWFATWGVASLIGGIIDTSYDKSVTPLVCEKAEGTIGKYIANEIVKRINANGGFSIIHRIPAEQKVAGPRLKSVLPQG